MADRRDHLEKVRTEVRQNFSQSLMSSSKWRALFQGLEDADVEIIGFVVKYVDDEMERLERNLPRLCRPYLPHGWVEMWNNTPLLAIEWIGFPRIVVIKRWDNLPSLRMPQDVDAIHAAIEAIGKLFPIEMTENGLRVVGHR